MGKILLIFFFKIAHRVLGALLVILEKNGTGAARTGVYLQFKGARETWCTEDRGVAQEHFSRFKSCLVSRGPDEGFQWANQVGERGYNIRKIAAETLVIHTHSEETA